ncbi:hypothetical protein ACW95P_02565 [Candidatus Mycoplasma pogonae]
MKKAVIEIDLRSNKLIKKSTQWQKIENEHNWYQATLKLDANFQNILPQIYNYAKSPRSAKVEMEYLPANNLAKYFVEQTWSLEEWKNTIKNLLKILRYFKTFPATRYDDLSSKKAIYFNKTVTAFETIKTNKFFLGIAKNAFLNINNQKLTNMLLLEQKVILEIKKNFLLGKNKSTLAHGNFDFSSILYLNPNEYKLIDPLGYYHKQTNYGDINYDLAFLARSISGKIDFITAGHFELKENKNDFNFTFKIKNPQEYIELEKYFRRMTINNFDITSKELIFLEALTFLHLFPEYDAEPEKQKMIYLIALVKFNQYFSTEKIEFEFI